MRKQMIVVSGFALVLALAACGKTNYNATSGNTKSTAKSNPGPTARAATPQAPPPTAAVAKSNKGEVLVDANGMTLYRFGKARSPSSPGPTADGRSPTTAIRSIASRVTASPATPTATASATCGTS